MEKRCFGNNVLGETKMMNIVTIVFKIIPYLIMGYGVYVCWSAFRANKKTAWLLICIFCLYPFITLGFRTGIRAIFSEQYQHNQHSSHIIGENGEKIKHEEYVLSFPIMQILLVIGLSFLAEEEIKRKKSQQIASSN
jgi:hypothetical protein